MEVSSGLTCPLMHPPCPTCVTCSHGIFPCTNKADFRSRSILSLGDMDAGSCSMRPNQAPGMNFQMPSTSHLMAWKTGMIFLSSLFGGWGGHVALVRLWAAGTEYVDAKFIPEAQSVPKSLSSSISGIGAAEDSLLLSSTALRLQNALRSFLLPLWGQLFPLHPFVCHCFLCRSSWFHLPRSP